MSIEGSFGQPKLSGEAKRDELVASLERTLAPAAWSLFEKISGPITSAELDDAVAEFNALGAEQLAENKPDPEESLAERAQEEDLNLVSGHTLHVSRSMRGVYTFSVS